MKKQVVVIHGGDTFATYEEYLSFLQDVQIDLERMQKKGWKHYLQDELGDGFEVISPQMPNKNNVRYKEWKIWFEKLIPFLRDNLILVGHSLGGIFLAKYLSENTFPKKIQAVFLVASPFDTDGEKPLPEFVLPPSLEELERQAGMIFLYHSQDDPVVALSEFDKYKQALPSARTLLFEDRQHFNQEKFPEIVEAIKTL